MGKPKDRWTKTELTLRPGPKELAKAVIEQWHLDGEPECDRAAIEYWKGVIKTCEKETANENCAERIKRL